MDNFLCCGLEFSYLFFHLFVEYECYHTMKMCIFFILVGKMGKKTSYFVSCIVAMLYQHPLWLLLMILFKICMIAGWCIVENFESLIFKFSCRVCAVILDKLHVCKAPQRHVRDGKTLNTHTHTEFSLYFRFFVKSQKIATTRNYNYAQILPPFSRIYCIFRLVPCCFFYASDFPKYKFVQIPEAFKANMKSNF